jgi:plasmid stabilization system protein ParE
MLVFTPAAIGDLRAIARWYRENRPTYEDRFFQRLRRTLAVVEVSPLSFEVVLVRAGVRRAPVRRSPYAVAFVVRPDAIKIIGVLHGARDPSLLARRSRLEEP